MLPMFCFWILSFFSAIFSSHAYEVVIVSDAIVDHVLFVDPDFLTRLSMEKGKWHPVDHAFFSKIIEESGTNPILTPGGSAVNVSKGLANLGYECALIAKIGKDPQGAFCLQKIIDHGIAPLFSFATIPTAASACLITPDGDRTMCTFLGAAKDLSEEDVIEEYFRGAKLFHLEGYQLIREKLVKRAIAFAKAQGAQISLDLSSVWVVNTHRALLNELLETEIDIVFANQEEAQALTSLEPQQACEQLAKHCKIAIVTMGERGGWVTGGASTFHFPAQSAQVIDTTGAGDLFASGFLHGYLQGHSLEQCAWYGSIIASHIVEVIGAELPAHRWETIRPLINSSPEKRLSRDGL